MTPIRRNSLGTTLIDLMVAVALVAIVGSVAGSLAVTRRARVTEAAQAERALQWLEYEADVRLAKGTPDPAVVEVLRQGLADAALTVSAPAADRTSTLAVTFKGATGRLRQVELKLAGVAK